MPMTEKDRIMGEEEGVEKRKKFLFNIIIYKIKKGAPRMEPCGIHLKEWLVLEKEEISTTFVVSI